jgi:hypothetical protein
MATFTVDSNDGTGVVGNKRWVRGTFTTTTGDTTVSLTPTTTGLYYIVDYDISLDTGGIAHQNPKVSISSGTITCTFDDTLGYGGTFYVLGN